MLIAEKPILGNSNSIIYKPIRLLVNHYLITFLYTVSLLSLLSEQADNFLITGTLIFSDDRSVDVFRNKIESATQMQSVLDSGKRPNCLVIDEIDGAPTVSIFFTVCFCNIKPKERE